MKHSTLASFAIATLLLCSCSKEKSGLINDVDIESVEIPELTDAADSLAYYLGVKLSENLTASLDTLSEAEKTDIDAELFMLGARSVLATDHTRAGYQYGALHGGAAQRQIINIRAGKQRIVTEQYISGFAAGMDSEATDSTTETLGHLLKPVNSEIIKAKRRTSKRNNFRMPNGKIMPH